MLIEKSIQSLLEHACPPIRYRLRQEVLNQSRSTPLMLDLQKQILEDQAVKEVIGWQGADGWLAWNFHGYHSTESGIRLLCEKGVDPRHPVLTRALQALKGEPGRLYRGIGKAGRILDATGLGGALMIRAGLFACAGFEDETLVEEQVELALSSFKGVLAIDRIEDLVETYKGRIVYRQGVHWPSLYHLRLLAWTHGWRIPQNKTEIVECIRKLVKLSPLPDIHVRHRSQLIAPASFCMDDFIPNMPAMDSAHWMMWFHRMELLARLGVVNQVQELQCQVAALEDILEAADGLFTKRLAHDYFRKWGAYTGLMLEANWRDPQRRIYDLTFRSLLILHFAEVQAT